MEARCLAYAEGPLATSDGHFIRRMMHHVVPLNNFAVHVWIQPQQSEAPSSTSHHQVLSSSNSSSSSGGSSHHPQSSRYGGTYTPHSFPPTPRSCAAVISRGDAYTEDVLYRARDELRSLGSTARRMMMSSTTTTTTTATTDSMSMGGVHAKSEDKAAVFAGMSSDVRQQQETHMSTKTEENDNTNTNHNNDDDAGTAFTPHTDYYARTPSVAPSKTSGSRRSNATSSSSKKRRGPPNRKQQQQSSSEPLHDRPQGENIPSVFPNNSTTTLQMQNTTTNDNNNSETPTGNSGENLLVDPSISSSSAASSQPQEQQQQFQQYFEFFAAALAYMTPTQLSSFTASLGMDFGCGASVAAVTTATTTTTSTSLETTSGSANEDNNHTNSSNNESSNSQEESPSIAETTSSNTIFNRGNMTTTTTIPTNLFTYQSTQSQLKHSNQYNDMPDLDALTGLGEENTSQGGYAGGSRSTGSRASFLTTAAAAAASRSGQNNNSNNNNDIRNNSYQNNNSKSGSALVFTFSNVHRDDPHYKNMSTGNYDENTNHQSERVGTMHPRSSSFAGTERSVDDSSTFYTDMDNSEYTPSRSGSATTGTQFLSPSIIGSMQPPVTTPTPTIITSRRDLVERGIKIAGAAGLTGITPARAQEIIAKLTSSSSISPSNYQHSAKKTTNSNSKHQHQHHQQQHVTDDDLSTQKKIAMNSEQSTASSVVAANNNKIASLDGAKNPVSTIEQQASPTVRLHLPLASAKIDAVTVRQNEVEAVNIATAATASSRRHRGSRRRNHYDDEEEEEESDSSSTASSSSSMSSSSFSSSSSSHNNDSRLKPSADDDEERSSVARRGPNSRSSASSPTFSDNYSNDDGTPAFWYSGSRGGVSRHIAVVAAAGKEGSRPRRHHRRHHSRRGRKHSTHNSGSKRLVSASVDDEDDRRAAATAWPADDAPAPPLSPRTAYSAAIAEARVAAAAAENAAKERMQQARELVTRLGPRVFTQTHLFKHSFLYPRTHEAKVELAADTASASLSSSTGGANQALNSKQGDDELHGVVEVLAPSSSQVRFAVPFTPSVDVHTNSQQQQHYSSINHEKMMNIPEGKAESQSMFTNNDRKASVSTPFVGLFNGLWTESILDLNGVADKGSNSSSSENNNSIKLSKGLAPPLRQTYSSSSASSSTPGIIAKDNNNNKKNNSTVISSILPRIPLDPQQSVFAAIETRTPLGPDCIFVPAGSAAVALQGSLPSSSSFKRNAEAVPSSSSTASSGDSGVYDQASSAAFYGSMKSSSSISTTSPTASSSSSSSSSASLLDDETAVAAALLPIPQTSSFTFYPQQQRPTLMLASHVVTAPPLPALARMAVFPAEQVHNHLTVCCGGHGVLLQSPESLRHDPFANFFPTNNNNEDAAEVGGASFYGGGRRRGQWSWTSASSAASSSSNLGYNMPGFTGSLGNSCSRSGYKSARAGLAIPHYRTRDRTLCYFEFRIEHESQRNNHNNMSSRINTSSVKELLPSQPIYVSLGLSARSVPLEGPLGMLPLSLGLSSSGHVVSGGQWSTVSSQVGHHNHHHHHHHHQSHASAAFSSLSGSKGGMGDGSIGFSSIYGNNNSTAARMSAYSETQMEEGNGNGRGLATGNNSNTTTSPTPNSHSVDVTGGRGNISPAASLLSANAPHAAFRVGDTVGFLVRWLGTAGPWAPDFLFPPDTSDDGANTASSSSTTNAMNNNTPAFQSNGPFSCNNAAAAAVGAQTTSSGYHHHHHQTHHHHPPFDSLQITFSVAGRVVGVSGVMNVPRGTELYPTVSIATPGIRIVGGFSAADVAHGSRQTMVVSQPEQPSLASMMMLSASTSSFDSSNPYGGYGEAYGALARNTYLAGTQGYAVFALDGSMLLPHTSQGV